MNLKKIFPGGRGVDILLLVHINPAPGTPPRRWTLAGRLDASKKELDPSTTREAVVFQNNPQPELAAVLELRRKPPSVAMAVLKMAALPAALAAAALACHLALAGLAVRWDWTRSVWERWPSSRAARNSS
ncbi:MAG: hypothetical protein U0931_21545 [Vulcanimicrobiota bacterium]